MNPIVANQLIVSMGALREPGFRLAWLREKLEETDLQSAAAALEELIWLAYSGTSAAREALLAVCIYLVVDRKSPLVGQLRQEAHRSSLLNLERLLRRGTDAPTRLAEGERRVPDYGTGRELTVGERRSLARRPSRAHLERLLLDPHPLVLRQLFECPALTEADVLRVIVARPARQTAIETISEKPRWLFRRRIRTALIQNPGCPQAIALPLIGTCPRDDLASIVKTTTLSLTVRSAAHELFLRLPPIELESPCLQ